MFKVFLYQLLGDVAGTPCTIANRPEMLAPVALAELREFELEKTGRASFETLHEFTDGKTGGVFDMHMDMIFADYSLENFDVVGVTDLHD